MSRTQLARLLEDYRDASLDEPGARRLVRAIRGGGDEARWILDELAFTGVLVQALDDIDEDSFVRSILERLAAERTSEGFASDFAVASRARKTVRRASARFSLVRALWGMLVAEPRGRAAAGAVSASRPRRHLLLFAAGGLAALLLSLLVLRLAAPPAVAAIQERDPGVAVYRRGVRISSKAGMKLRAEDTVQVPPDGSALIRYPDASWLRLRSGATVTFMPRSAAGPLPQSPGKRLYLTVGELEADIREQPVGGPTQVSTPHAVAEAAAGRLTVTVSPSSTRVETKAGRVALVRGEDGRRVVLAPGYFAIATAGAPLKAQRK